MASCPFLALNFILAARWPSHTPLKWLSLLQAPVLIPPTTSHQPDPTHFHTETTRPVSHGLHRSHGWGSDERNPNSRERQLDRRRKRLGLLGDYQCWKKLLTTTDDLGLGCEHLRPISRTIFEPTGATTSLLPCPRRIAFIGRNAPGRRLFRSTPECDDSEDGPDG